MEVSSKLRQLLKGVARSVTVPKDTVKYFYIDHSTSDEGFLAEIDILQGQADLYLSKGEESRPTVENH